jgi:uncharacterized membrane protein (UPF0127 family)
MSGPAPTWPARLGLGASVGLAALCTALNAGCPAPEAARPAAAPSAAPAVRAAPAPRRPALEGVPQPPLPTTSLIVGGKLVIAEVADDDGERQRGLMQRPALPPGGGMLFVYPDARPRSFWMKDTILPLSIAYIDEDGRIVSIRDMRPLDESGVPSGAPAQYALEMDQGWFTQNGVVVGAQIDGLPGAGRE